MDDQYTFENKTYKDTYRHTTSHILTQAMKRLYPDRKSTRLNSSHSGESRMPSSA